MNILVSACLLGVGCRYNGEEKQDPRVAALLARHTLIPVCPEQLGGLPTPREPAERLDGRVLFRSGRDATEAFRRGAEQTLRLAELYGCRYAILKERSPSCGSGTIHDGGFAGGLVPGDGVAAALLKAHGVTVLGESELDRLPGERAD